MKCPYNDTQCRYVNTSGETTEVVCTECECYDKGIRATGGCLKPTLVIALVIILLCAACAQPTCPTYGGRAYNNKSIVTRPPAK